MTDILERLTAVQVLETSKDGSPSLVKFAHPLGVEAADEIARLRTRVAELEKTRNNIAAIFVRQPNRTWTGDEAASLIFKAFKML